MPSSPGACAGSAQGARGGMKIINANKIKAGCKVLVVSSTYTGDLEDLFKLRVGYIPTEVHVFVNKMGTRFYCFEEVK